MNPKEVAATSFLLGAVFLTGCRAVKAADHITKNVPEVATPVLAPTPDLRELAQMGILAKIYKIYGYSFYDRVYQLNRNDKNKTPIHFVFDEPTDPPSILEKLCSSLNVIDLTNLPQDRLDWPVSGPIFTYFSEDHDGIDIDPPYGTPIFSADDGVVVHTEKLGWSYGWYIVVNHNNELLTLYAHLSRFGVKVGDHVGKKDQLGAVGNTGRSTGTHLHFETLARTENGCVRVNSLDILSQRLAGNY